MLRRRRTDRTIAIACCCAALGTLVPVALYQTGMVKELPDPPGRLFDSPGIVTSGSAFPLGIPDAILGLASYGSTLALLLVAGPPGTMSHRIARSKLLLDGALAAFNFGKQIVRYGKLCSWCTATALATAGEVHFGLPR